MTPADQHLHDLAAMMGVAIEYTHCLPADRDGDYSHSRKRIRIREGLHSRRSRSVLAHELGHAAFGHIPSPYGPVLAKQERAAEEWGALRLIDLDDYRAAEREHDGHAGAMAVSLGVLRTTVLAFQSVMSRLGEVVYVSPRMGSGQWARREDVHA